MTNQTPVPENSAPQLQTATVPPMPTDEFRDRRRPLSPVDRHRADTFDGELSTETAHATVELFLEAGKTADESALFQFIASWLPRIIDADRASIALLAGGEKHLEIRGLHGDPADLGVGDTLPVDNTAVGHASTAGTVLRWRTTIPNAYGESEPLRRAGLDGVVNAPISVQDQIVGTVSLGRADGGFTSGEAKLLTDVATVVGFNLDRLRWRAQAEDSIGSDRSTAEERWSGHSVDESPLLMLTFDGEARITRASRFGASQLGYRPGELEGRSLSVLYPPEQQRPQAQNIAGLLRHPAGTVMSWDAEMVSADGAAGVVRHTARRLEGDPAEAIVVCEDISGLLQSTDSVEPEATHDPLTGLLDGEEFALRLADVVAEGDGTSPGSVCLFDVDNFGAINDTVGRRAGDVLLTELGRALAESIQDGDPLARSGGDEFAALLPGCSLGDAVRVAERLRQVAGEVVFNWGGATIDPTFSVGVVAIDPTWTDPDEALARADAACYNAKMAGGDQVSVVSRIETTGRRNRSDGDWAGRLGQALANGDLRLVAQPIVPVGETDGKVRAEMLVRLAEPSGELLTAASFVPPAERLGLVTDIDRWVLWEVTDLISHNRDVMKHVDFLSVNLSAKSIESDDFFDDLLNAIARPEVDPSKLLFEISETAALSQLTKTVRFVRTATAVGCRFAIDDFGAGFSSFNYLRRLPVEMLKIDGSVIRDLPSDPIADSVVKSIAEVATALGMKTTAEFVEDDELCDALARLGVDFAQGYGLGRPTSLDNCLPEFTFPRRESLG